MLIKNAHFIPINEPRKTRTMNALPPPAAPASPPPAPSPADQQKIAALAGILGVDPRNLRAIADAIVALLGPYSDENGVLPEAPPPPPSPAAAEIAARRQLSASEKRAVDSTPGATAARYLAAKKRKLGLR